MADEWYEIVISQKQAGISIEAYLREVIKVPKKLLHLYRMEKMVKLNGELTSWSTMLEQDDKLELKLFEEEEPNVTPLKRKVDVLYEDPHMLIVNKPSGMDVHPNNNTQYDTLLNAVAYYMISQGRKTKIRHIHRLDKDTTGAVLFAKHTLAGAILDRFLEKRLIKRTYIALVNGRVRESNGIVNEPIGRDRHHPTRRRVSPGGQEAITRYKVLKYYPKGDNTLLKLELETGRTHQIRVHMSYIGHPLLGDVVYGGNKQESHRQALHAAKIVVPHPFNDLMVKCIAPANDKRAIFTSDMLRFIK